MGKTVLSDRQANKLGLMPSRVVPFVIGFVLGFLAGVLMVYSTPSVPSAQETTTASLVGVHFNRIGIAQWCAINTDAKTIQCNYDTQKECNEHMERGEFCRSNPFYIAPKEAPLKEKLREPKHTPPSKGKPK